MKVGEPSVTIPVRKTTEGNTIATTNLERVRTARGLTLRALAEKLRCTYQAPHTWERRQNKPTLIFREQLEKTLGYPVDVLLSDDPTLLNENDRQR